METTFILILFLLLILYYVYSYNKIISSKQEVDEAWADIDVQLKRRYDLIPNLIDIVKGYNIYENSVFKKVTEARSQAISLGQNDIVGKSDAESNIGKSLKTLFAIAEGYPELKANSNFLKLQQELTNTEDEIASARRIYNSNVANFNSLIGAFPKNIIASIHHFTTCDFFQNEENTSI